MSLPLANRLALAAGVGVALLFFGVLLMPAAMSQPASLNPGAAAAATPLPPLPPLKSPVDFFRELLAMNLPERKQTLADRKLEDQKRILAKVREYESLKPDQRELRLRATELRWYLLPLMTSPATNRPAQLALIPPEPRKLVEDRLQLWDKLPAAVQKDLLENEATLQYLTPLESASEEQKKEILKTISPARREKLEAGIARWRKSSELQRQETLVRFNQFFDLTPREKDNALNTLSEAERRQMEKTLRVFENLPKSQRERCIQSFEKFAGMSLEERQQFLKNSERWRLMRPEERQAWRDMVPRLPELPPSPPGLGLPPPPPNPPGLDQPVATNRN